MADAKLPALPAITELADDDLVYLVDISDTTDDPGGSSRGVTVASLRAAIGGGGGGGGGGASSEVLLEEIELTAGGEFDFNNIPQDCDSLVIEGAIRSTANADFDGVYAVMNDDEVAVNYISQVNQGYNGGSSTPELQTPKFASCGGATSPAGAYVHVRLCLDEYAGTKLKSLASEYNGLMGTNGAISGIGTVAHKTMADPITRLRIRTDNHPTDGLTGKLRLIGRKALPAVAGGGPTLITEIDNMSAAGSFSFTSLDLSAYNRVYIRGVLESAVVSNSDAVVIHINGDTNNANYEGGQHGWRDGVHTVNDYPGGAETAFRIGEVPAVNSTPNGVMGSLEITIEHPSVVMPTVAFGESRGFFSDFGQPFMLQYVVMHETAAAVSQIDIATDGGELLRGHLQLWGE